MPYVQIQIYPLEVVGRGSETQIQVVNIYTL